METNGIFENTLKILESNLDLRSKKHSLLTSNLANIDTPNYKSFDFQIKDAMSKVNKDEKIKFEITDPRHLLDKSGGRDNLKAIVNEIPEPDIDKLMANLAQNSILYNASVQILNKKFSMLKESINGGAR